VPICGNGPKPDLCPCGSIGILTSDEFPSIRSGLISKLSSLGTQVYDLRDESDNPANLSLRIRYRVDHAKVEYQNAKDEMLDRSIQLVLYQTSSDANRAVLSNNRCERSHTDTIVRTKVGTDPSDFEIVRIDSGRRSFIRPALLAGTVAAITYLFFTVRSSE